jgi:hypothetical protein
MTDILDVGRVAALNDILRRSLSGGTLVLTAGIVALGRERQQVILDAVAAFDGFEPDNDPHSGKFSVSSLPFFAVIANHCPPL